MAITLTSNEAAINIEADDEQNNAQCAIDINLYDKYNIPLTHSDQENDGDWRNGAELLFKENTGVFEQLLAANNGNQNILRGKIAEYAGFTLDGQNCVWSWGDMNIDKLTYFIIFKVTFPNATDDSQEFSFTDRLNVCNHVRWYFWNRQGTDHQGITVRNAGNEVRRIRRLHRNGEQEVEPENNSRPSSHTATLERKNRDTQEDYEFFGTGYPHFLQDALFGAIPNTNPVEYRKLDIAYYGLAAIENKFYSDWIGKRKSIPHFPADWDGLRPDSNAAGVGVVRVQFNTLSNIIYFVGLNGNTIHFYRTPRIVSVNTSNNTFIAEYFYRSTIRVGVFDDREDPPELEPSNRQSGNINFRNDGNIIRGSESYRVVYVVDENNEPLEPLSNIISQLGGHYFLENPPSIPENRNIIILRPSSANLHGTFTSIPNGVNISDLVGHYIQQTQDSPHLYGIIFPNNLDAEFQLAGIRLNNRDQSGLTFGVGVDIGQSKDEDWLNSFFEQNSEVWTNLSEQERRTTLNEEDDNPPGIYLQNRRDAMRFYFRNRKYFDDLNMQNNLGNWVQNIRSVSEPIPGHLTGRSFIDHVFTGDLDTGEEGTNYRVFPRMRSENGLVASPNSVELLAILPLIYQSGTGSFDSFEIRRRFTHAINTHNLEALRDAVRYFIDAFGSNNTRKSVNDFVTNGAMFKIETPNIVYIIRNMFDITRLQHYFEDIHLNNEI